MTRSRLAAWWLVGLLALAVALRGGVLPGAADALALSVALSVLALAALRALPTPPPAALALALAWVVLGLASSLWSVAPDRSLDAAAGLGAAALIALLAAGVARAGAARDLLRGVLALGIGVATLAVVTAPPAQRVFFPFGNPNHLAGWLLAPASLAIAPALRRAARAPRDEPALVRFALALSLLAALAATRSRGAWLAGGAALAALALLERIGPRRGMRLALLGWAAGALALAGLAAVHPGWLAAGRASSESSVGLRWRVYGRAARGAWAEAPLGSGLGSFAVAFLRYQPPDLPYAVGFAHSEPIELAFELGLPALLLLGVSLAVLASRAESALRRDPVTAAAVTTALFALAAHALIDFPLHVPAIGWLAAALAGCLWTGPARPRAEAVPSPRLGIPALALAGLVAGLAVSGALASRAEKKAAAALARGEFARARALAAWGLEFRPARTALWSLRADAAEAAAHGGEAPRSALLEALETRERAVRTSPRDPALWVALARTRAEAGEGEGALAALAEAHRCAPALPLPRLARAEVLLELGQARAAQREVRRALAHEPALARAALRELAWLGGRQPPPRWNQGAKPGGGAPPAARARAGGS